MKSFFLSKTGYTFAFIFAFFTSIGYANDPTLLDPKNPIDDDFAKWIEKSCNVQLLSRSEELALGTAINNLPKVNYTKPVKVEEVELSGERLVESLYRKQTEKEQKTNDYLAALRDKNGFNGILLQRLGLLDQLKDRAELLDSLSLGVDSKVSQDLLETIRRHGVVLKDLQTRLLNDNTRFRSTRLDAKLDLIKSLMPDGTVFDATLLQQDPELSFELDPFTLEIARRKEQCDLKPAEAIHLDAVTFGIRTIPTIKFDSNNPEPFLFEINKFKASPNFCELIHANFRTPIEGVYFAPDVHEDTYRRFKYDLIALQKAIPFPDATRNMELTKTLGMDPANAPNMNETLQKWLFERMHMVVGQDFLSDFEPDSANLGAEIYAIRDTYIKKMQDKFKETWIPRTWLPEWNGIYPSYTWTRVAENLDMDVDAKCKKYANMEDPDCQHPMLRYAYMHFFNLRNPLYIVSPKMGLIRFNSFITHPCSMEEEVNLPQACRRIRLSRLFFAAKQSEEKEVFSRRGTSVRRTHETAFPMDVCPKGHANESKPLCENRTDGPNTIAAAFLSNTLIGCTSCSAQEKAKINAEIAAYHNRATVVAGESFTEILGRILSTVAHPSEWAEALRKAFNGGYDKYGDSIDFIKPDFYEGTGSY